MTAPLALSLCICTYNRADLLRRTLPSFAALAHDPAVLSLELVLVDNNSRDDTRAAVEAVRPLFPYPLRYVFERRQGLSIARNTAVDAASGDYLGFFDDECVVRPDWAQVAVRTIAESGGAILGGPYYAGFLEGRRPRWFKEGYGDAFFLRRRDVVRGFVEGFRASGGNMIARRDVFDMVRFDPAYGMHGDRIGVGEETYLQSDWLARNPGAAVWYEPDLALTHLVRREKMSLLYKLRRDWAIGLASGRRAVARGRARPIDPARVRRDIADILLSPWRAIRRDRDAHPYWQNFYYEVILPGPVRRLARDRAMRRARRAARPDPT